MHSLVAYAELSTYEICGVYSYKYSGQVGKVCSTVLQKNIDKDYIIQNVENINWEADFDAVIIGHLDELSNLVHRNLKRELIDKCFCYRKNIYSLDCSELGNNISEKFGKAGLAVYYPKYVFDNLPKGLFGRMFISSTPILGFFGTSSIQGKFTLQLEMKKRFQRDGFAVGLLATEATGLLLGADYVFPFGYASTTEVQGIDAVVGINHLLHKIEVESKKDIIIVGSQSLSVPCSVGNTMYYPCCQTDLLFAIDADAIILSINYTDDNEYIRRTISFLESANESKVIAIVLYPCRRKDVYAYLNNQMIPISSEELTQRAKELSEYLDRPIYILGFEEQTEQLYQKIIEYFVV